MRQPRKGLITQGKQQGRSDEQGRHDEMAEHIVDHRIVIVHDVELVEISQAGKLDSVQPISNAEPAKAKAMATRYRRLLSHQYFIAIKQAINR